MGREDPATPTAADLPASQQAHLVAVDQIRDISATTVKRLVDSGMWLRRHPGVYQVDRRPQVWRDRLWAAVLAGGPASLVSHRSALVLWGLDGISTEIVEITVPYTHGPVPEGVVVHRTRRVQDAAIAAGVPATSIERTLLDCAGALPTAALTKAIDSAVRLRLVGIDQLWGFLGERGGRGVRGTKKLRSALSLYMSDIVADSGSESEALYQLRLGGVPEPLLQFEIATRNGPRRPDFFWPQFNKAVEVDGLDAHASARQLEDDLSRQNDLLEFGIGLRRFSARQIRRNPGAFVDEVRRFLEL